MCTSIFRGEGRVGAYTLNSHNLISNSPYCLAYNSYEFSLENLELDQPMIP